MKFSAEGGREVLEIILPPEVLKTPEAMENFFTQVWPSGAADNLMQVYIDGKRPPILTYEIVSRGGDIHFYITAPTKIVQMVRDNLYAQYPGVDIQPTKVDYTAEVPNSLADWGFVSFHMNKKKDDHIPIKTYIDYGLDKTAKEEEKVDPMTPMLEALGSIKPGQQIWVQYILKTHRALSLKSGSLKKEVEWDVAAHKYIDEKMQRDPKTKKGGADLEGFSRITKGEQHEIERVERNIEKVAFDVSIRWCIMSAPGVPFNASDIGKMLRAFAQTEIKGVNGIGMKWRTDFNYHWFSDPFGKILPALKKTELAEYKKRVLYPKGGGMGTKVFSVEELATLFHLPGTVAMTPTLNRVTSARSEAPSNLPTGN